MAAISEGLIVRVGADVSQFDKGMRHVKAEVTGVATHINRLGRMAKGTTIAIAMLGAKLAAVLAGAIALAVKLESNFEKALGEVSTLLNGATNQMLIFRRAALEMALAVGEAPTRMVRALYQTISAGITATADAIQLTKIASWAAIAALTTTEAAVDILTSAINAYSDAGSNAAYYSDILFTSVRLGKLRFEDLVKTMGRVMPIASQLGVSFSELNAAVVTLTRSGIRADIATTYIRAALTGMARPTMQAAAAAKKYGVEWDAAAVIQKGLVGVLRNVHEQIGGNVAAMAQLSGNIRGMTALITLAGAQFETFEWVLRENEDAMGATAEAAYKMTQTISFQWGRLVAGIKSVGIGVGKIFALVVRDNMLKLADMFARSAMFLETHTRRFRRMFAPLLGDFSRMVDWAIRMYDKIGGIAGILTAVVVAAKALRAVFFGLIFAGKVVAVMLVGGFAIIQTSIENARLAAAIFFRSLEAGAWTASEKVHLVLAGLFRVLAVAFDEMAREAPAYTKKIFDAMASGAQKAGDIMAGASVVAKNAAYRHRKELDLLLDIFLYKMSKHTAGKIFSDLWKSMDKSAAEFLLSLESFKESWGGLWTDTRRQWREFAYVAQKINEAFKSGSAKRIEMTNEELQALKRAQTQMLGVLTETYEEWTKKFKTEFDKRVDIHKAAAREMERVEKARQRMADEWQEKWFRAITIGMSPQYIAQQHAHQARWYRTMARETDDYDRKVKYLTKSMEHELSLAELIARETGRRDPTVLRHIWEINTWIVDVQKEQAAAAKEGVRTAKQALEEMIRLYAEWEALTLRRLFVWLNTGQATQATLELIELLAKIHDKVVTITVKYVEERQAGGRIGARGTDTVPAMLTPGEFVVNREATARFLPLLEAINSGTRNLAFASKMQYGGQVTNATFGNINIHVATLDRRTLQHEVLPALRQIIERKRI